MTFPPLRRNSQGLPTMLDEYPNSIDQPFAVPFVHRLRFTRDVLGPDSHVLADVLPSSGGRKARVQFWVDEHLLAVRPDLRCWVGSFAETYAASLEVLDSIQVVPGGEAIKNDTRLLEQILRV